MTRSKVVLHFRCEAAEERAAEETDLAISEADLAGTGVGDLKDFALAEDFVEHGVSDGDAVGSFHIIRTVICLVQVLFGDLLLKPSPKSFIHGTFRDEEVALDLGDEP